MGSIRQLCTFSLGELSFGMDVRSIQEIVRHQEMTRVPTASPVVRGLINMRGQIVLAIDLRHRIGLPQLEQPKTDAINVIIRTDDRPVSLLVDDIGDILDLNGESMEPPPETMRGDIRRLIEGIYKLPDRLLLVLDAKRVADFDVANSAA
jgi:purine-binding chemotaxis protein CheW